MQPYMKIELEFMFNEWNLVDLLFQFHRGDEQSRLIRLTCLVPLLLTANLRHLSCRDASSGTRHSFLRPLSFPITFISSSGVFAAPHSFTCHSDDGSTLAIVHGQGGLTLLKEVYLPSILPSLPPLHRAQSVALNKNGSAMVTGHTDNAVRVWDTSAVSSSLQQPIRTFQVTEAPHLLGITGDIVVYAGSSRVHVWKQDQLQYVLEGNDASGHLVALSENGIIHYHSKTLTVHDLHTGVAIMRCVGLDWADAMAVSPDGRWLAMYFGTRFLGLMDLSLCPSVPKFLPVLRAHYPTRVYGLRFSPDSTALAILEDGELHVLHHVDHSRAHSASHLPSISGESVRATLVALSATDFTLDTFVVWC